MIQNTFTVRSNEALTDTVYRMVLEGPLNGAVSAPGQFVNLKVPGHYLRRPISVCDWTDSTLTLIYKVVGHGTEVMAQTPAGASFDLLAGLGNGFDTAKSGQTPLLVGGGIAIPPLYGLCKALLAEGKTSSVLLGFNTAEERFLVDAFEQLLEGTGGTVYVTTVDGSAGTKGFVTDVMKDLTYTYFYTCGPGPMF
ncbi:MAG: dihydroorotate dehydrogenase electron transfer subunit, partial [Clostridia bacterium]|nr:dihydroorotate dehydrogenase electron transfer subunit [Clostridia bacterium]